MSNPFFVCMDIDKYKIEAEKTYLKHKETIVALKKTRSNKLDDQFHKLHQETFENVDCLTCANCCKTTSPIFYEPDINRIAKTLKMKVNKFINTYLHKDDDNDYVLNKTPCPFLGYDNKCIVYESRPRACREYPHTNRKRIYQILNLTLENTQICPAVHRIVSKLGEVV